MRDLDDLNFINLKAGKKFTFIDKSDVVDVIVDPIGLALTVQVQVDSFSSMSPSAASLSLLMFIALCYFIME